MFCRKCGAELRIKAGAKFCGKCGAPIAASKTSVPEPEKKPTLISSMPKPGSSGTSSNGEKDNWFSDAGDL